MTNAPARRHRPRALEPGGPGRTQPQLVRLNFDDELTYKEIAARTGLTAGNVGFILHHALKTIAAELAKTGVVP